jgi:UDP-N-acetylmuramate--alanine ligase
MTLEYNNTEENNITEIILSTDRRYHFVGIGGIGMSAIAQVLLARGFRVSGSDARPSPLLERLRTLGADVAVGHDAGHVLPEDVLVLSDAIRPENPEWQQALAWSLPIITRAELLACLTNSGRGVAVSGTHGKTTSSGMLAQIFIEAGFDPTCILGGELATIGSNARTGGDIMLVEACEAYNSFLKLSPEVALLTNVDVDHLDFHQTPEHLFASFRQFLRQVRAYAVVNGDDTRLRAMAKLAPRMITYGVGADNDYRITGVKLGADTSFVIRQHEEDLGTLTLQVPGMHNVSNAAGAAALALEWGAPWEAVSRGLAAFPGMHRRFERMGTCGAAVVLDDYAHHPTEIRATLAAARGAFPGRVIAVFQPHLYSRTRDLLDEFANAFKQADLVLIAPIYAARELPMPEISHQLLVERLLARHPRQQVLALCSLEDGVQILQHAARHARGSAQKSVIPALRRGDVIITIGAGDVDRIAHAITAGHAVVNGVEESE